MNTCTEEVMEPIVHVGTLCDTLQKYVLVGWPEIQLFMDHPRWSECIFLYRNRRPSVSR